MEYHNASTEVNNLFGHTKTSRKATFELRAKVAKRKAQITDNNHVSIFIT